jgi:hypothetical protein
VDEPSAQLRVLVNGRAAYWASESPIPGGVAYENFEIIEPFAEGREAVFWIEPLDDDAEVGEFLTRSDALTTRR